jgi:large subunit ribosomal protein L1
MPNEKILNAVKQLREKAAKRNFSQSIDLVVSLKELDLKKGENKFTDDVVLPNGRGKEASVIVFSDTIKDAGEAQIFTGEDLNNLAKNTRSAKKLVGSTEFFLSEPKLMPVIGKVLGQFVGPRGKLPKIISGDVKGVVKNLRKSVRVRIKDAPVIQCLIGKEDMKDEEIAENVEAVLNFLEKKLPKGKNNIGKLMLKTTMGHPVKIDLMEAKQAK